MEKLGWGPDCRLGVDPPLHSPNPLFPSYALTHRSDLTSPASPTLPPGKAAVSMWLHECLFQ